MTMKCLKTECQWPYNHCHKNQEPVEPVVSILISQWSKANALIQPTFIIVTLLRWITTHICIIYISYADSLQAAKENSK